MAFSGRDFAHSLLGGGKAWNVQVIIFFIKSII
jgi:hypothetical protein